MRTQATLFLALLSVSIFPTLAMAQFGNDDDRKLNLDLPVAVEASARTDDDLPPEVVVFYGQTYESEAIFFCLDQSLSMGPGAWEQLQQELARVVTDFSKEMQFGIVFFHEEATVFPTNKRPAVADTATKQAAIAMVNEARPSDRSTCFLEGLKEALKMANQSEVKYRTVIFMSDGKATCVGQDSVAYIERTFNEVRTLNTRNTTINTVGVGFEVADFFLKSLAEQNSGTYRRIKDD
ncbi:MAG: vWA domain-containing protein [Planctomycetota bacterium]